jgi:hypothetical protein
VHNRVVRYLARCGREFDVCMNVLLGGDMGCTLSYRAALAARDGRRWGCFMCWFLDWAVQEHHCDYQFEPRRVTFLTYARAAVAFAIGIFMALSIGYAGYEFTRRML